MQTQRFSYPQTDEDHYFSAFRGHFSSIFVGTNAFLNIPQFPLSAFEDWIPDEASELAKTRGENSGVSWSEIANLCDFPSIAHVNRALRLTGSRRISEQLSCPSDTEKMLKMCQDKHLFMPDEGSLGPLQELESARFLDKLGHTHVTVADNFGNAPRVMKTKNFLSTKSVSPSEIHAEDGSVYLSIYSDYHYFLICQTEESRSKANPAEFFEGFFADETTNDLWGVGDLN